MLKEFKEFAMRGNVVDMAVGIIIGGAFGTIVKSMVSDVLMPPIGLLMGGVDFANLFLTLKEGAAAGPYLALADAKATAALWRFCDTQDLPCYQIPRDLVLKDEVSLIIEGFQNNLQEEIEAEISEFTEDEDSENDDSEDVPF